MKKIIISIVAVFLFTGVCYAELYVIYDKQTKEIYSVSEKNDTVLPIGKELKALKGKFADYDFQANPTDMKYIDGKFITNTQRINDRYLAEQEAKRKQDEEVLIQAQIRQTAIDKLKTEGKLK